jgi:hypothetical protein
MRFIRILPLCAVALALACDEQSITNVPEPVYSVVTDEQDEAIAEAVASGVAWLAAHQNGDGSWGSFDKVARTCFALIKLQDMAWEIGSNPFDPEYEYSGNVLHGWAYVFNWDGTQGLSLQDHTGGATGTMDDPDVNGNGVGKYFDSGFSSHRVYTTGVCLMALEASGTPERMEGGETFQQMAQDAADWMAFAQGDLGNAEGGWGYSDINNGSDWTDNSNGGYAVLGLAAAENFGCTVPAWVRTELNVWIGVMQDPVDGDANDGCSYYTPGGGWCNELKTGNLVFEMTYYGDDMSVARFGDAMDYIERHWRDTNTDPGWGYGVHPASYQAMYTLMKGFEFSNIDLIDLDGDNSPEHDWFEEFAQVLLDQQNGDGSWPHCDWGDQMLCTTWALLTLEKISPVSVIEVPVDIKPGSCPNPINTKSKGVLPVAILGTEDFDVTMIDPSTVTLWFDDVGVSPLRWEYEDVGTPYGGELCGCHDVNGDGYTDMTLKFSTPEVMALDLTQHTGEMVELTVGGNLLEEHGGTAIEGADCVRVSMK